jgi:hypothetical protein
MKLNSKQNPEECDATDDDSSTTAGFIKINYGCYKKEESC